MINNNEKQITIKVFISQNIESHNIQINKHEKIKNIKNIISNALNLDSTKIYLTYNNFNLEENESIQDELIMNISGNNKMPYFKVNFINEKKNLSEKTKKNSKEIQLNNNHKSLNNLIKSSNNELLNQSEFIGKNISNSKKYLSNKSLISNNSYENNINNTFHKRNFSTNNLKGNKESKLNQQIHGKDLNISSLLDKSASQMIFNSENIKENFNSSYLSSEKINDLLKEKNNKRKSKYSQSSNKNTTNSYILQKELFNLKNEILELNSNPINLNCCVYFDNDAKKEFSDIEKQILFIEVTINNLCNNLIKAKENLISNLVIRKDFFDNEKKANQKLLHLLSKKTNAFNSELHNLLNQAKNQFNINVNKNTEKQKFNYDTTKTNNKITTSNSVSNIKQLFNEENVGTKFYSFFNTIYELKIEKNNIIDTIEKLNKNILNFTSNHNLILHNLESKIEELLFATNRDKDNFASSKQILHDKNKIISDNLENNMFSCYKKIEIKNNFNSNFENLTKIKILKDHLSFNKDIEFGKSDLNVKITKSLNLIEKNFNKNKTYNLCFSFADNSDKIYAYSIQAMQSFIFKALFPRLNRDGNKFLQGSKMIQIANTNSAFITGGFESNKHNSNNQVDCSFGNGKGSNKCFFFSFDYNGVNHMNYSNFVEYLENKIGEDIKNAEAERIQNMFIDYNSTNKNSDKKLYKSKSNLSNTAKINKTNNGDIYIKEHINKKNIEFNTQNNNVKYEINENNKTNSSSKFLRNTNSKNYEMENIQALKNNNYTNNNSDNTQCSFSGVYCNKEKDKERRLFNIELTEIPQMNHAHWRHSLLTINNKYLICVSGFENKKCEYFDFSDLKDIKKSWKSLPDLNIARMDASLFHVNESYLFCFGGISNNINIHNTTLINNTNNANNSFVLNYNNNNNNLNNSVCLSNPKNKKMNFYFVNKIERLKLNKIALEKSLFNETKQWEFLNVFNNYGENNSINHFISQMGTLKINSNNLLLIGGNRNLNAANKNDFNNDDESNYDNSIRLVSIDDNGNTNFNFFESKLSRNSKFNSNNQFLEFYEDENLKRFYCYDSNNEICKIDLKI